MPFEQVDVVIITPMNGIAIKPYRDAIIFGIPYMVCNDGKHTQQANSKRKIVISLFCGKHFPWEQLKGKNYKKQCSYYIDSSTFEHIIYKRKIVFNYVGDNTKHNVALLSVEPLVSRKRRFIQSEESEDSSSGEESDEESARPHIIDDDDSPPSIIE